ncbi:hypothetical protein PHMEG_0004595 [Phytophthora megakarya]|uniref:Uncharacterized protein n=1 Tax=Phytophthora megakarya TaxID=4795 RepID=A0A225WVH7_9STRA|nr:hypothetical protein PHMEG_0004595 [Phytophthora megakarya]
MTSTTSYGEKCKYGTLESGGLATNVTPHDDRRHTTIMDAGQILAAPVTAATTRTTAKLMAADVEPTIVAKVPVPDSTDKTKVATSTADDAAGITSTATVPRTDATVTDGHAHTTAPVDNAIPGGEDEHVENSKVGNLQ